MRRQVSAPLRLSLMALYGLLGCPRLLLQQAHSLDIKHILLDTVAGRSPLFPTEWRLACPACGLPSLWPALLVAGLLVPCSACALLVPCHALLVSCPARGPCVLSLQSVRLRSVSGMGQGPCS